MDAKMNYYTITGEYVNKNGHTRSILIVYAINHEEAIKEWTKLYNVPVGSIHDGIYITDGFDILLTEHSRKYLLKAKTNKESSPVVSYSNSITLKHIYE